MPELVTVYSKPTGCMQCNLTKHVLEEHDIEYEIKDITTPENMEYVMGLGYQQAPVVVAGDEHWSGFLPGRLKDLATT